MHWTIPKCTAPRFTTCGNVSFRNRNVSVNRAFRFRKSDCSSNVEINLERIAIDLVLAKTDTIERRRWSKLYLKHTRILMNRIFRLLHLRDFKMLVNPVLFILCSVQGRQAYIATFWLYICNAASTGRELLSISAIVKQALEILHFLIRQPVHKSGVTDLMQNTQHLLVLTKKHTVNASLPYEP